MTTLSDLVAGTLYGTVLVEGQAIPVVRLVATDARRRALVVLRQYLSLVTMARSQGPGKPLATYNLPKSSILLEQPDDPKTLTFPSVAVLAGDETHDPIGLGPPFPLVGTEDQFGPGTVLVQLGEVLETFQLELWASHKVERRGLVASIEQAFRPLEESYSLRLRMADYYGIVASFTLTNTKYVDDPDVIRGRRRALLTVGLVVPEVMLVRFVPMRAEIRVEVEDGSVVVEIGTS